MFHLFRPFIFLADDLSPEASVIISKFKVPNTNSSLYFDKLGNALIEYLDCPELINAIFVQIYTNYGDYAAILNLSIQFALNLTDHQIESLSKTYIGSKVLDLMASMLININPDTVIQIEKTNKINFQILTSKIQRNYLTRKAVINKPFVGDIVPNNTGISDRYGKHHDGIHVRSPKNGGRVITIEELQGVVIRQYVQEYKPKLFYGVWVLTKTGIVVIYKDLTKVDTKLRKLTEGKLYLNARNEPTSKTKVMTGEEIGTISKWSEGEENNRSDAGLHLAFVPIKFIKDFGDYLKLPAGSRPSHFPLEKLIAPCGDESPVKCL